MTTPDVNIFLVNFPSPGKEMVVSNEDGTYTILINAKLSQDGQLKAYQHALSHINNGDFDKSDVQDIESKAHDLEISTDLVPVPVSQFEKRIKRLRKERKRLQRALREKEQENKTIIDLYGYDNYLRTIENQWLYGGIE